MSMPSVASSCRPLDAAGGVLVHTGTVRRDAGGRLLAVTCTCGFRVYDGEVVRCRVFNPHVGAAKCRCTRWVHVPVKFFDAEKSENAVVQR